MRHVIGIFLAIVLAGAIFAGGGWGVAHMIVQTKAGTGLTGIHGLSALGVLLATGLLAGILLAAPRVSPLATALPGLVLLGWTALLVVSEHRALSYIPLRSHSFGIGFQAMLTSGMLALLGMALLFPLFIPSRWHRALREEDDEDELAGLPAPTGLLS
jgi:hypothetical protein